MFKSPVKNIFCSTSLNVIIICLPDIFHCIPVVGMGTCWDTWLKKSLIESRQDIYLLDLRVFGQCLGHVGTFLTMIFLLECENFLEYSPISPISTGEEVEVKIWYIIVQFKLPLTVDNYFHFNGNVKAHSKLEGEHHIWPLGSHEWNEEVHICLNITNTRNYQHTTISLWDLLTSSSSGLNNEWAYCIRNFDCRFCQYQQLGWTNRLIGWCNKTTDITVIDGVNDCSFLFFARANDGKINLHHCLEANVNIKMTNLMIIWRLSVHTCK